MSSSITFMPYHKHAPPMASSTLLSSNPRVFSSSISDHHHHCCPFSQSPTVPKSFSGLCKPFHSRVPTSIRRRGFVVKATVIKWRCPKQILPPNCDTDFQKKVLYLESIGIDSFSLIENHPTIISASLPNIKSTVEFLTSMDFSAIECRRIVGMCPEILTCRASDLLPVFTFLIREARVNGSDIKRVINRRPRLLVCSVTGQLRPTLYFLQSIGIEEVNKHTYLLSCSVEEKLIPRIDYFENIGFSRRDATSMFRRFPQLFNYSIKNNLEPKYKYFVVEMGRDLKELKEFPQYFSFSLEGRIKPRHKLCLEMGVYFPLPVLLKTNEARFRNRLDVCVNSSTPLKTSPLWCSNCEVS
ncbi:transcription termination factor MTEF1, chloroplastic [Neltuma alba]|uniref:transcription termination factor MTEF1, chloroplastic n=1 Tax=Neltuma alba TaxID=207710 RepID=UPI0010A56BDD|nr:transcription termination factor MTEF1, chloroplastic-like [Prosopis alba]